MFQVLLHYRAARFQDFVNLSQQVREILTAVCSELILNFISHPQVHLYNQRVVAGLHATARGVNIDKVDTRQNNPSLFGAMPMPLRKIPFKMDDIPYYDTSYMCDIVSPVANYGVTVDEEQETWDAPLQPPPSLTQYLMTYNAYKREQACQTNWDRRDEVDVVYEQQFSRDPTNMRR